MGQARDEAGNIWEVDAQGNAIRLIEPAGSGGQVFSLPPNPKDVAAENRAQADQQMQERRFGLDVSKAERDASNDALNNEVKRLELLLKTKELSGEKPGDVKENRERVSRLRQLEAQINRVQQLYGQGVGTTQGLAGLQDYLPTNENAQFDAAGAALSQQGLAAFRVPGTGTVSDRDAIMFDRANLPTASTRDLAIEEQLRGLRSRVEEEYKTLGIAAPNWQGQRADNEVPDPTTGADLKAPPIDRSPDDLPPANGPQLSAATGRTREALSERASAMVDSLINAGASKATIDAALKRQGYPTVNAASLARAKRWMKDNPGKRYYGSQISRSEDLSLGERIAGSAPGALLAQYANSATAGTVGALAGEQGQGALDAMAAANPGLSTVGQIAGGITGALGAETALAARAPAALAQYAPRIADALYGAGLGFNTAQEGEGAQGAVTGALAGAIGGALGERVMRGAGRAARGVQDANVGYLQRRGVPLTVGQALGGSGGLGASLKNAEDAMTSIPVLGSIVNARRMEGLEGFNRAAMQEAGAPAGINVTATGAQGMEQLRQGIGPAYDNALGGAQINTNDPSFAEALEAVVNGTNRLPPEARQVAGTALDNRLMNATDEQTGIISGRGFQEAYRGLGRTARERANGDYGYEIGQSMRQGQNALADALDAQNPGALEAFRNANAANRNANVIAQALDKAKNQGDEMFTPTQINTADAMSAKRLEGPMASAAGDRPFFDLARAGQEVLPSRLPDSGTATRGIVAAGLLGGVGAGGGAGLGALAGDAQTGAQTGLGLTLALAIGGSRPAQRALVDVLTKRTPQMVNVGNRLVDNSNIGGWTGAGVLSGLLGQ